MQVYIRRDDITSQTLEQNFIHLRIIRTFICISGIYIPLITYLFNNVTEEY